jgi:hypothetical protein
MVLLKPDDVMKYLFVPIVKTALENTKPFVNDYVLHLVRRTKPLVVHEMRFALREQQGFIFDRLGWNSIGWN